MERRTEVGGEGTSVGKAEEVTKAEAGEENVWQSPQDHSVGTMDISQLARKCVEFALKWEGLKVRTVLGVLCIFVAVVVLFKIY